jgi:hypothetical protein
MLFGLVVYVLKKIDEKEECYSIVPTTLQGMQGQRI